MSNNFNNMAREIFEMTMKYGGCTLVVDHVNQNIKCIDFINDDYHKENNNLPVNNLIKDEYGNTYTQYNEVINKTDNETQQVTCVDDGEFYDIIRNELGENSKNGSKTMMELYERLRFMTLNHTCVSNCYMENTTWTIHISYIKRDQEDKTKTKEIKYEFMRHIEGARDFITIFSIKVFNLDKDCPEYIIYPGAASALSNKNHKGNLTDTISEVFGYLAPSNQPRSRDKVSIALYLENIFEHQFADDHFDACNIDNISGDIIQMDQNNTIGEYYNPFGYKYINNTQCEILSNKTIITLYKVISQLIDDDSGTYSIHSTDETNWLITRYKSPESSSAEKLTSFSFKRAIDNQLGYKDIFVFEMHEYINRDRLPSYTLKIEQISGIPEVKDYTEVCANGNHLDYIINSWITANHPYASSIIKLFESLFTEYSKNEM